jgi:hypothetical protein
VLGATVILRMPVHFAPRRAAIFLAPAAIACFVLAACSPGADYPSLFPSVHDVSAPRTDTRLDTNQVQQATEDLISARDRLSAEARSAPGKHATASPGAPAASSPAKSSAKSSTKSSTKPSTKSSAKSQLNPTGKSSGDPATAAAAVRTQPSNAVSGRQPLGMVTEQAAGAETK